MASQPRHRRSQRGGFFLLLRLVTALAVAFISLPALNVSAQADELAPEPAPEVVATDVGEPALEEAVQPPPAEDPVAEEPLAEEPVAEEVVENAAGATLPAADHKGPSAAKVEQGARTSPDDSDITSLLPMVVPAFTDADLEAADYIVEDERGANDEPGQKDLTQFFGFTSPVANSVKIGWSWDEIDWSGNNTGDACALFDTDGDGKANYAVCVTITGKPAVQLDTDTNPSPRLYSCNDSRVDRCAGPTLLKSGDASDVDCSVEQTVTDPFAAGDAYPEDTSALCTIPLSNFTGGTGTPRLVNVCSFPSQEPNSDPSDCVLIPRDAMLTVVKVVTPAAAQDQTDFGFTISGMSTPVTFSLQQGESESIPVRSGVDLNLSENDIDDWRLVSASCSNQQEPSALKLASEATVTCTFTNTPVASVTVNKSWVINGTPYTNNNKPGGYSATLELTGQQAPTFGTKYSSYTIGDSVTIGERVTVPPGCQNTVTGDTGSKTLAAAENTYAITNNVTCDASVKVDKQWVINGEPYDDGDQPDDYNADLSLTEQADPAFGATYTDYVIGDEVTIAEAVDVPQGCVNVATGDVGDHTLTTAANTYTITNLVTCGASVKVDKIWNINGTSYAQGATIPADYTASLLLTDQDNPSFGTPYGGYTEGDSVTIGESANVPDGCTNAVTGDIGDKTLTKGLNSYTITNTVTCGASVKVDKTWVINGTTYHQGDPIPTGYSASLTLTTQPSPGFGNTYGGYREGQIVNVDETSVVVPDGCTNSKSGNGDKTLTKGLNTYTITNTVTCTPPPPPPPPVVVNPAWALTKASTPGSGSTVQPGQQVVYTLTATNTTSTVVDDAVVTDDLSDVLDNATLTQPLAAGLSISGTTLTWDVPTLSATGGVGSSATVSYTVTVDPDEWGETLRNVATPSGDGGQCPTPGGCQTVHPTPAWELTKASDPESGSEVDPGSDITYTLTVVNTSDAVLTGALAEDDLSEVLNNASLDEDSLDEALTLDGSTLTWAIPSLLPGEEATVSYTVTVDLETSSVVLENVVAPISGGGVCVEADDCTTTHSTPEILGEEVVVPEPKPEPRPRPPATVLPATGAPEGAEVMGLLGLGGLLLGGLLMVSDRRNRRGRAALRGA